MGEMPNATAPIMPPTSGTIEGCRDRVIKPAASQYQFVSNTLAASASNAAQRIHQEMVSH
jgi:hypothetical protein